MVNRQTIKNIKLARITADPALQPRIGINREMVADYAAAMRRRDKFPAVVVFFDGKTHWLSDGFHRYEAARTIKSKTILCEVHKGGRRDALLHSVSCNAAHGLQRSNDDKRMAVRAAKKGQLSPFHAPKDPTNRVQEPKSVPTYLQGKYWTRFEAIPGSKQRRLFP